MGNVEIVSILLQFRANSNAEAMFHVTPLHIATSPKVVQMLIRHNANLTAQMIDDIHETCGKASNNPCVCSEFGEMIPKVNPARKGPTGISEKNGMTCFQNLMNRDIKISEIVLDESISTNGERLDSSNLVVVYDLEVFESVGSVKSSVKMIENNPSLLGHPLYHALITTEWSNIKSVVMVMNHNL